MNAEPTRALSIRHDGSGVYRRQDAMSYLKSIVTGLVWAVVAQVVYVLVVFVVPLVAPFLWGRLTGSGGASVATFSEGPLYAVALVAFAIGFFWQHLKGPKTGRRSPRDSHR